MTEEIKDNQFSVKHFPKISMVQLHINKHEPGKDDFPEHINIVNYRWEKREDGEWEVNVDTRAYR